MESVNLVKLDLILFENQIQTTSTSPCRTQVQPAASFLVCSLIFIEYEFELEKWLIDLCYSHGRLYVFDYIVN